MEEREALRTAVPKLGLAAPLPGGGTVLELAREALEIARGGLAARARLNSSGDNETGFLDPLHEIVARGTTPAERLLELYHGEWGGDVSHVYEEFSF
jgi:glutamate--cysteine ligase